MYQAGKAGPEHVLVAQPPFLHAAGFEVLDQHIRRFQEPQNYLATLGFAQVQRRATLVAVDAEEVGRGPDLLVEGGPQARTSSPCGGSILITSAP